jgi:hypothetical protein
MKTSLFKKRNLQQWIKENLLRGLGELLRGAMSIVYWSAGSCIMTASLVDAAK